VRIPQARIRLPAGVRDRPWGEPCWSSRLCTCSPAGVAAWPTVPVVSGTRYL